MQTIQEPAPEHITKIECNENGQPVWYTTEEVFDELDKNLIEHFGEEYRKLANERRTPVEQKIFMEFWPTIMPQYTIYYTSKAKTEIAHYRLFEE
jgi:hypothetical protein